MTSSVARNSDRVPVDPLATAVVTLVMAMRADFGDRFARQFDDGETAAGEALRQFKRRLYKKLRPFPIEAILNGYESATAARQGLIPSIPEIVAAVEAEAAVLAKRQAANSLPEIRLPRPAAPDKVAAAVAAMRGATAGRRPLSVTDPEAFGRLVRDHEALLAQKEAQSVIRRVTADPSHLCAVSNCRNAGSLSTDTRGGTQWYCRDHFIRG